MNAVYLDHNATTPVLPEVVEAMAQAWGQVGANPASQHQPGQWARRLLEDVREETTRLLGADPTSDRLVFTASGTEANCLALLGIARAATGGQPGRVILSSTEHASVIGPAEQLLEEGWQVDTLAVGPDGVVLPDRLEALLDRPAQLVSVQAANHETGVIQPIGKLARICQEHDVPLHTDAVQWVGKLPAEFRGWGVAAMSVAAHKFHGPTGIGALVLRDGLPVAPLLRGGHQQGNIRAGTEPVALAVGMAAALRVWHAEKDALSERMTSLRTRFETGLKAALPEVIVHGHDAPRLPQTSNVAFPGVDGQVLFTALDLAGVACSVGSACDSGSSEISPTLLAMGLPSDLAARSLRFSLG
ncbi:MAG: cysteine desulfurase, partial [Pirellulales bacterium]|nr:cysteine desulfurase [Pirellulales bacterium]